MSEILESANTYRWGNKAMIPGNAKRSRGGGTLQFLVIATLLVGACWAGYKMARPYYAYRSLQRTMQQWARITLYRGGWDPSELRQKIRWIIDRHDIPLSVEDVEVVFDREEKTLTVSAQYDVYVELPGYVHHYFFQPYAEVHAGDDCRRPLPPPRRSEDECLCREDRERPGGDGR